MEIDSTGVCQSESFIQDGKIVQVRDKELMYLRFITRYVNVYA